MAAEMMRRALHRLIRASALLAAVLLLYLVIFIRPTRFKRNVHRGRTEQPQKTKKTTAVGKPALTSRMRTDAQRARLQKIRGNR